MWTYKDNELYHYGVLGMKWGVRKQQYSYPKNATRLQKKAFRTQVKGFELEEKALDSKDGSRRQKRYFKKADRYNAKYKALNAKDTHKRVRDAVDRSWQKDLKQLNSIYKNQKDATNKLKKDALSSYRNGNITKKEYRQYKSSIRKKSREVRTRDYDAKIDLAYKYTKMHQYNNMEYAKIAKGENSASYKRGKRLFESNEVAYSNMIIKKTSKDHYNVLYWY